MPSFSEAHPDARDALVERECKKEACAIQDCLAKNDYREERCKDVIGRWRLCKRRVLAKDGQS